MNSSPIIESCVSTLEEAIIAEERGADQIELCARLDLDGLTPSRDLTQKAMETLNIPVKVMIRPRDGDFNYHEEDCARIKQHIDMMKALGVRRYVYGSLRNDSLDLQDMTEVYDYITSGDYPLESFTIHKSIDLCADLLHEVDRLLNSPFLRSLTNNRTALSILSSGGAATAKEGHSVLRAMVRRASSKITIIAAGKVTSANLPELHSLIEAPAYHGRRIISLSY